MVHTRSPHLTEPCWHVFPSKEIPGEISLQTYTRCGSGVRLLSPCVGMTKVPTPASMTPTSMSSCPTLDTCSYTATQNLTQSQSRRVCSSGCIGVLVQATFQFLPFQPTWFLDTAVSTSQEDGAGSQEAFWEQQGGQGWSNRAGCS